MTSLLPQPACSASFVSGWALRWSGASSASESRTALRSVLGMIISANLQHPPIRDIADHIDDVGALQMAVARG